MKITFFSLRKAALIAAAVFAFAAGTHAQENTTWLTFIGGQADDLCGGAVITSDSCYMVAGSTKSKTNGEYDVYLAKISRSGKLIWDRHHGGKGNDFGASIANTADGGYIIAGRTETRSAGKFDAFLMKVDSIGNLKWSRNFGGAENDYGVMAIPSYEGGYYLLAGTESKGAGGADILLVRTDSLGKMISEKTFGGAGNDYPASLYQSTELNLMIIGTTLSKGIGGTDIYVIRTDNYGRALWDKTFGSKGGDFGRAITQANDGNYLLLGTRGIYAEPDSGDIWLAKIDRTGKIIWESSYEDNNRDAAGAFTLANGGDIAIVGDDDIEQDTYSANPVFILADGRGKLIANKPYTNITHQNAAVILRVSNGFIIAGTAQDGDSFGIYLMKTRDDGEMD